MKKLLLKIGAMTIFAMPFASAVACGENQTELVKPTIMTDLDQLSSYSLTDQKTKIKSLIDNTTTGKQQGVNLNGQTYIFDYSSNEALAKSVGAAHAFITKYFPAIMVQDGATKLVDTGVIKFDTKGVIPPAGAEFMMPNMPAAPLNTHWMFRCDELYMEVESSGEKIPHWTRLLKSFKTPFLDDIPSKYIILAKLAPDFGYIINNDDLYELEFVAKTAAVSLVGH